VELTSDLRGYVGTFVTLSESVLLVQARDFGADPLWTTPSSGIEEGERP
jgi:hypothetical protein